MINREEHQKLWQQKRNELPLGTDMNADWSEMNDLLGKHMPVPNPGNGSANTGGQAGNLARQLTQLVKTKLFYTIGGLIFAGAVTYSIVQYRAAIKINKPAKTEIRKDSVAANVQTAPGNATDSTDNQQTAGAVKSLSAANPESNGNKREIAIDNKANSTTISTKSVGTKTASAKYRTANGLRSNNNNIQSTVSSNWGNRGGNNTDPDNSTSNQQHMAAGNNFKETKENVASATIAERSRGYYAPLQLSAPNGSTLTRDIGATSRSYPVSLLAKLTRPVRLLSNPFKKIKPGRSSAVNKNLANSSLHNKNSSRSEKSRGSETSIGSDLDWGILTGVNTSGSFTPKAQNRNIYGSLTPDIYLGLFATYNINDNWAIGFQGRVFTPHTISGSYSYTHHLTADSSQTTQLLGIHDSRKVYTVDVPVYAVYKATPNIHLKAGAIFSFPVKQVNGTNSFDIYGPLRDSVGYYSSVTDAINASSFEKKIRIGGSLGIGYTYKFLWLDATYNFQRQKINSALGSYHANTNSLQLTLGIKFNKSKK